MAASAAVAASGPWPSASTTATSAWSSRTFTTYRSPQASPATRLHAVALHSISGTCNTPPESKSQKLRCSVQPLSHGDVRPFLWPGHNVKLIHQPSRSRQTQPEAPPGGIAVLESQLHVGDARP